MRRFAWMILAATLGCGVGLGTSELWLRMRTVPYCTVARSGDWYHDQFIRVKARVIFGSGGVYIYEDCDPTEALASSVELEGTGRAMGFGYVDEVLVTGEKPEIKTAEAIIEGRFDGHASTGCWRPKFHIAATKIELVSDVSAYNPGQANDEGTSLRTKR